LASSLTPLRSWFALASRANWKTPADIKQAYRNASFTGNNRVVFNIKGTAIAWWWRCGIARG
jgi:mRNA-degrading endonuclease HigB of HigAB toxin-antitoxin module